MADDFHVDVGTLDFPEEIRGFENQVFRYDQFPPVALIRPITALYLFLDLSEHLRGTDSAGAAPQHELGHVHAAVCALAVVNPRLRLSQFHPQVALRHACRFTHLSQQLRKQAIGRRVLRLRHPPMLWRVSFDTNSVSEVCLTSVAGQPVRGILAC